MVKSGKSALSPLPLPASVPLNTLVAPADGSHRAAGGEHRVGAREPGEALIELPAVLARKPPARRLVEVDDFAAAVVALDAAVVAQILDRVGRNAALLRDAAFGAVRLSRKSRQGMPQP